MERVCESCASQGDDLVLVRRVVEEDASPAGGSGRIDRTELWCFDCRAEHAHDRVEET